MGKRAKIFLLDGWIENCSPGEIFNFFKPNTSEDYISMSNFVHEAFHWNHLHTKFGTNVRFQILLHQFILKNSEINTEFRDVYFREIQLIMEGFATFFQRNYRMHEDAIHNPVTDMLSTLCFYFSPDMKKLFSTPIDDWVSNLFDFISTNSEYYDNGTIFVSKDINHTLSKVTPLIDKALKRDENIIYKEGYNIFNNLYNIIRKKDSFFALRGNFYALLNWYFDSAFFNSPFFTGFKDFELFVDKYSKTKGGYYVKQLLLLSKITKVQLHQIKISILFGFEGFPVKTYDMYEFLLLGKKQPLIREEEISIDRIQYFAHKFQTKVTDKEIFSILAYHKAYNELKELVLIAQYECVARLINDQLCIIYKDKILFQKYIYGDYLQLNKRLLTYSSFQVNIILYRISPHKHRKSFNLKYSWIPIIAFTNKTKKNNEDVIEFLGSYSIAANYQADDIDIDWDKIPDLVMLRAQKLAEENTNSDIYMVYNNFLRL